MTYQKAGVRYDVLDRFKRLAQKGASDTYRKSPVVNEVPASRGESAFVWEENNCYRAFVLEGLGTKNRVADEMAKTTHKTYYDQIAKDAVASAINDLIVVGATPQVLSAYFAVGSSEWFSDERRSSDLVNGWTKACFEANVIWGGGETPALSGIVEPDTIDLAESVVGIVKPKKRLTLGDKLKAGDAILLVESSGIHANGLTLARAIADTLPKGYATKLSDATMYGEALLTPTIIYSRLVESLFAAGIDIHYMVHITGHGWRKLMRANQTFTYRIDTVPALLPIFSFIQEHSGLDDSEMYGTFNMGAGFAIYLPEKDRRKAMRIVASHKLKSWCAGCVEKGPKRVIIAPKNITYASGALQVR